MGAVGLKVVLGGRKAREFSLFDISGVAEGITAAWHRVCVGYSLFFLKDSFSYVLGSTARIWSWSSVWLLFGCK